MRPKAPDQVLRICRESLAWAEHRNYTGYNKHDGLNSPLLRTLSFGSKWPRILFIQTVMRCPVNVRPLLGVRKARNPKGISLFARAYLNLYRVTGHEAYRGAAVSLLDWLLDHPSTGFRGLSWGYPYPWQDLGFFAPAGFPNRVVTCFVGRALVEAYEVLGEERYLDAAGRTVEFALEEPKVLFENEQMKCLSYVPIPEIKMAVMDVSALVAVLCAAVGKHVRNPVMLREARRLLAWVVDKQTPEGAWFYTHPPNDSPIRHDNYHTGYIVDAIHDYAACTGDDRFSDAHRRGLVFYRENLFTSAAQPKWMSDREFPYDIHGYAQGIISFSKAGELELAGRIAQNAIRSMWNSREGRFRYQRGRLYTKGFTLMRWCQAWMAHAMSYYLAVVKDRDHG